MIFRKVVICILIFCGLIQPIFSAPNLLIRDKKSKVHQTIKVLFTYQRPNDFSEGENLILNFFIVNLSDEANVKTIVKKINRSHKKTKVKVTLAPSEMVFAFIYSESHPFSTFNSSKLGRLKAKKKQGSSKPLPFVKYDAKTGITLFDPFHLEK
jgi:hypothetical protein